MLLTEFLNGQGANWEGGSAAPPSSVPRPPKLYLPPLPPPATACDLAALRDLLGTAAADALRAQLGSTAVGDLLRGALGDQRAQLLAYADQIDAQIAEVTCRLTVLGDLQATLGDAQGLLTGLQDVTGSATAAQIGTACPAAGYLLGLAGGALATAQEGLTGAASMLGAAQQLLTSLQGARDLVSTLLGELDARLDALPDLLDVFRA